MSILNIWLLPFSFHVVPPHILMTIGYPYNSVIYQRHEQYYYMIINTKFSGSKRLFFLIVFFFFSNCLDHRIKHVLQGRTLAGRRGGGLPARLATGVCRTRSPVSATVRHALPKWACPSTTFPAGCRPTARCVWSSHAGRASGAWYPVGPTTEEDRAVSQTSRLPPGRVVRTATAADCSARPCGPRIPIRRGRGLRCRSAPWSYGWKINKK